MYLYINQHSIVWLECIRSNLQVFHVLETVSQVTQERMVQVFQHPSLSYYISDTFRANDFIFSDVFEGEGKACIFPFDDSNFAESAFADHS